LIIFFLRALLTFETLETTVSVMLMRTGYEDFARPTRPSLLSRVYAGLGFFAGAVESYVEFRRQRRELLGLDDRMLKDIGLSRGDIMRIKPMRDPRTHRM
jgi:uncharacterized protein YjiS (DUF1127 family)